MVPDSAPWHLAVEHDRHEVLRPRAREGQTLLWPETVAWRNATSCSALIAPMSSDRSSRMTMMPCRRAAILSALQSMTAWRERRQILVRLSPKRRAPLPTDGSKAARRHAGEIPLVSMHRLEWWSGACRAARCLLRPLRQSALSARLPCVSQWPVPVDDSCH